MSNIETKENIKIAIAMSNFYTDGVLKFAALKQTMQDIQISIDPSIRSLIKPLNINLFLRNL